MIDIKNYIIIFLFVALCSVTFAMLYTSQMKKETNVIEKKVPIERINYNTEDVKDWMLRVGVSDAWISLDQVHMRKADCFSTVMFPDHSVLSYCKLRSS